MNNMLQSFSDSTPVRVSQHVQTNNGTVIDLGGIFDLGVVPAGKCSVYDNGQRYIY